MKQYEEYKTTNIPWLDKIPKHWELLHNTIIFKEKKDIVGSNYKNYTLLSLTTNGIVKRDIESGKGKFPASFNTYKKVEANNIIFCLFDIDETPRTVGLSKYNGMITGAYNIFDIKQNNIYYIYYYYLSLDYFKQLKPLYSGLRKTIKLNKFFSMETPIPPKHEQDKIVAYLDYQTSNINKLILSKRKQIELLEEYKKTKISEAVTKGLNPNAEMKESGIDWIGQIPKHWEVRKINELFIQRKTKVSDKEYSPLSVTKNGVVPQLMDAVKTDNGDNRKLVCANDFVINSRSDRKSSCGVSDLNGSVSLIYLVLYLIKKDSFNIKLIHYLFRSYYFSEEFYRNGRGIVADLWTTRYTEMKNIYIPIPSQDEQKEIADYLDNLIFKLDNLISKHKLYIEKLEEYKKTLISDVVTGKIDVRDIDIPEYEKIEINEDTEEKSDDEVKME